MLGLAKAAQSPTSGGSEARARGAPGSWWPGGRAGVLAFRRGSLWGFAQVLLGRCHSERQVPYSGPRGFHESLERGPGRARLLCPGASAAPASGGRRCGLPVSSTLGGGVSGDLSSQSPRLGGPARGQPSPTLLEPPQGLPWPPRLEGCPGPSAGKASLLPLSSSPFPGGGAEGGRGVGLGPCPASWPRRPERLGSCGLRPSVLGDTCMLPFMGLQPNVQG